MGSLEREQIGQEIRQIPLGQGLGEGLHHHPGGIALHHIGIGVEDAVVEIEPGALARYTRCRGVGRFTGSVEENAS